MKNCEKCGCELKEEEKYCPYCGTEVKGRYQRHKSPVLTIFIFVMIGLIIYGEFEKYGFSIPNLKMNLEPIVQELVESLSF